MNITFSKDAVKTIERLDASAKKRIKRGVAGIPKGDIKPLKGARGVYRLRVGDWRILFSYMDNENVYIRDVGSRGDIYKRG